jgi:hypothetical protein
MPPVRSEVAVGTSGTGICLYIYIYIVVPESCSGHRDAFCTSSCAIAGVIRYMRSSFERQGRKYISCRTKNATSTLKHRFEAVQSCSRLRPITAAGVRSHWIHWLLGVSGRSFPRCNWATAALNCQKQASWRCRRDPPRPPIAVLASQKKCEDAELIIKLGDALKVCRRSQPPSRLTASRGIANLDEKNDAPRWAVISQDSGYVSSSPANPLIASLPMRKSCCKKCS